MMLRSGRTTNAQAAHHQKAVPRASAATIKTTELYAFSNEEAKREASKNALV
jgi:hypothetical protein